MHEMLIEFWINEEEWQCYNVSRKVQMSKN